MRDLLKEDITGQYLFEKVVTIYLMMKKFQKLKNIVTKMLIFSFISKYKKKISNKIQNYSFDSTNEGEFLKKIQR